MIQVNRLEKIKNTVSELVTKLKKGDRFALAKALTIIESSKANDRVKAVEIIDKCWQNNIDSWRLGITGPPGVGKSTFIDRFGMHALEKDHKLAVLTIDPSSTISFGSILGDKTRMENISNNQNVFIRPSPNQSKLGGIQERTSEAIILCEAAGFDLIIVETVGVGQSEIEVRKLVDCMAMLLLPNAGDELQGIKRGVMELADIFVVHKAEEANLTLVNQAIKQLQNVIHIQRRTSNSWIPKVMKISSLENLGLDNFYITLNKYFNDIKISNIKIDLRLKQYEFQINTYVKNMISEHYRESINSKLLGLNSNILSGKNSPLTIANQLFKDAISK